MAHPTWLPYGFAVLMVAISLYCVARLALARPLGRRNHVDVSLAHVLMGLAMVEMLVPRWDDVHAGICELVFAALAVYFLAMSVRVLSSRRSGQAEAAHGHHVSHYLVHMFMSCAMLYMYWLGMPLDLPSGGAMSMAGGSAAGGDPGLTLLILAGLVASATWQVDTLTRYSRPLPVALAAAALGAGAGRGSATAGPAAAGDAGGQPWLAPRLEIACHVAMCVTMGYMLVLMV